MEREKKSKTKPLSHKIIGFQFKGTAREYFSIWVVNVALTILTLGVYSAWAKVRTQQYFYGSTYLDGATFRYLADPKQILKGRVIAAALFAAYYFSGLFSPLAGAITAVIIIVLIPYILTASMAFRARVSEWRHVRFGFDKHFTDAYKLAAVPLVLFASYTLFPFLLLDKEEWSTIQTGEFTNSGFLMAYGVLTVLIMFVFPWMDHAINRFRVANSKFGQKQFSFSSCTLTFYKIYFIAALGFVLMLALLIGLGTFTPISLNPWVFGGLTTLGYFWAAAYLQAKRGNTVLNNTALGEHRLYSKLSVLDMWGLYSTNTLAIVISLGLLIPWAKVRTARYRASRTSLIAIGKLDNFAARQYKQQSALGEEMGEMFDVGLGF